MQFTENEITRSAILLSQRYGSTALDLAKKRHRELAKTDDSVAAEVWQRIVDALERIENPVH
jgi:hypothetical protein